MLAWDGGTIRALMRLTIFRTHNFKTRICDESQRLLTTNPPIRLVNYLIKHNQLRSQNQGVGHNLQPHSH